MNTGQQTVDCCSPIRVFLDEFEENLGLACASHTTKEESPLRLFNVQLSQSGVLASLVADLRSSCKDFTGRGHVRTLDMFEDDSTKTVS